MLENDVKISYRTKNNLTLKIILSFDTEINYETQQKVTLITEI